MTALLYAIADCDRDSAPERTRTGRRLRAVGDAGPVAILAVEPDGEADGRGDPAALREHESTVAELMAAHTLLPARYGTRLTEAEAEELLRERREDLVAALARVRGAVEVSVAARTESAATAAHGNGQHAGAGTAYLHHRLDHARALARIEELLRPLEDCAREHRRLGGGPAGDGPVLRQAYLVDRERLPEFLAALRRVDEAHDELELLCTGPWPPYSFCGVRP